MTAFTTIPNALVQVGAKPFATTIQALRDNPIAIAEKDTSVPVGFRVGYWLLGTLNTPGTATTYTLSGLDLSTYEFLLLVSNGVAAATINVDGQAFRNSLGSATGPCYGSVLISLRSRYGSGVFSTVTTVPEIYVRNTGITQSTTSVTLDGSGAFSGGSMLFYGVR